MQKDLKTLLSLFASARDRKLELAFYQFSSGEFVTHSYADLWAQAQLLACELQLAGVKRQDPVAIFLPTGPSFVISFMAILIAGGIPTALYPPLRLGKIDEWRDRTIQMLKQLGPGGILTDKLIFPFLGNCRAQLNTNIFCWNVEEKIKQLEQKPFTPIDPPLDEKDIAFIQFSSGSTGTPKPVAISHRSVLANAHMIIEGLELPQVLSAGEDLRGVSWLPLYHDMGLVGAWLSSLMAPGRPSLMLIRPEQFLARPAIWPKAISAFKANVTVAPNFAYALAAKKTDPAELQSLDLTHWKVALCGAETIHPHTFQEFLERFAPCGVRPEILTPVYGLAEATLAVTFSSPHTPPHFMHFDAQKLQESGIAIPCIKDHSNQESTQQPDQVLTLVSLGTALASVELSIRNQEGHPLPPGTVGDLWIKCDSLMSEYRNLPEATAATLQAGWLNSGDRGFLYEQEFYIYGRAKEIIIHRGRNYDPTFIELSLHAFDFIRPGQVIAFGDFDPTLGTEKIILLAEMRELAHRPQDLELDLIAERKKQISQHIQSNLQLQIAEVVLVPVGSLPKTSSGKLKRQEARLLWKQKRLTPPPPVNKVRLIKQALSGHFAHYLANWQLKLKNMKEHKSSSKNL